MRSLRNRITLSQVTIVGISLPYAWYSSQGLFVTIGETVKMGGSVGFTGRECSSGCLYITCLWPLANNSEIIQ